MTGVMWKNLEGYSRVCQNVGLTDKYPWPLSGERVVEMAETIDPNHPDHENDGLGVGQFTLTHLS
jgi:hypothetical protein